MNTDAIPMQVVPAFLNCNVIQVDITADFLSLMQMYAMFYERLTAQVTTCSSYAHKFICEANLCSYKECMCMLDN